jgi:hypothetical protein
MVKLAEAGSAWTLDGAALCNGDLRLQLPDTCSATASMPTKGKAGLLDLSGMGNQPSLHGAEVLKTDRLLYGHL